MKGVLIGLSASSLAACNTVGAKPSLPNPSYIEYSLPFTTATVGMDAVLESCDPPQITGTVTITPIANPSFDPGEAFRVYGSDLDSFTKARQLDLELYPDGAIKSVNGGVSDRTGAIITNILKTAAGLIPLAGGRQGQPVSASSFACTPKIRQVLDRVDILKKEIAARRSKLAGSPFAQTTKLRDSIDTLAAEVARIQTGALKIHVEREVAFKRGVPDGKGGRSGDTDAGYIRWQTADFSDWFGNASAGETELFSLTFCVDPPAATPPQCPAPRVQAADSISGNPTVGTYVQRPGCYNADIRVSCQGILVLRNPERRTMRVYPVNPTMFGQTSDTDPLAKQDLEISQWGEITELPLRASFGQNYTFAFGLDEFGKPTSGSWKSDARGENITGSLASIADAAGGVKSAFKTDVQQDQDEITRLETRQKLNQLEFCKQVIAAGGFTCPDAPKPSQ